MKPDPRAEQMMMNRRSEYDRFRERMNRQMIDSIDASLPPQAPPSPQPQPQLDLSRPEMGELFPKIDSRLRQDAMQKYQSGLDEIRNYYKQERRRMDGVDQNYGGPLGGLIR